MIKYLRIHVDCRSRMSRATLFRCVSWQLHNPFELRRAPGGALFVVAKLKTADSGVFLEARLA